MQGREFSERDREGGERVTRGGGVAGERRRYDGVASPPRLADEMLHAEERSLSPPTPNRARGADGSRRNQDERRVRREREKNETTPQWYKSPRGGYQGRRQSL